MTYHNVKLRSAMTAIAAVLALSPAPLFAQSAPDPVPESTTEPVTPDPLAPEPVAPEGPVVTDTASQPAKTSEPAAKPKAAARRPTATARSSATRSSVATATEPVANPAPATEESANAPVAAAPVAPPPTVPAENAAADQARQAAADRAQQLDDTLELVGAAGAGLLALAGAGLALRSRKRRSEEERLEEAKWAIIEASPDPESQVEREPAFTRAPTSMHDPAPANSAIPTGAPATRLPNGFDLSRFGPHVQAAYRGPTPDNPSLSLKYRLRRAGALDQQAHRAANEAAARPAAQAPTKPAWAQPAQTAREEAKFMLRRAGTNNGAKPVYQR
jgi:hypothetical protein